MSIVPQELPKPDNALQAHSELLCQHICDLMDGCGGKISFAQFMKLALYAPGLGYYSAGQHKIGKGGDFITAPEISSLFSSCLANQCAEILQAMGGGCILEFGAGTGEMATDILISLDTQNNLPDYYYIIEVSADLSDRQKKTINKLPKHLATRVIWLSELPQSLDNVIVLANEVLDAMPVEQFTVSDSSLQQVFVTYDDAGFTCLTAESESQLLEEEISHLKSSGICFSEGYHSEVSTTMKPWLQAIHDSMKNGVVLLIDYGYPRKEYYHESRHKGTLQCYFQHRVHDDPLKLVGLQDITAHVDFTAVAEAAVASGFTVSGYTSQAMFLLNTGLPELLTQESADDIERFNRNQQVKQLTLPTEMGEQFKVMALGKGYAELLMGFSQQNRLHLL